MERVGVVLNADPNELVARYAIGNKASIHDKYIIGDDKIPYFCAADVVILSYKPEFKCTSSMLWETATYKLPIIASDKNTLANDVKKYGLGLLFKCGDATDLALRINEFIKGNGDIGGACQRFSAAHSPAKWTEACKSMYGEVKGCGV